MRQSGKERYNGGTPMATRILVVDDDLRILPLLQRGLAYEGFEVYTAVDGESGLAAAKQNQPHLVLLDIAMPGLDGFELCRRLRLQEDIAIIMLTARDEVKQRCCTTSLLIRQPRLPALAGAQRSGRRCSSPAQGRRLATLP